MTWISSNLRTFCVPAGLMIALFLLCTEPCRATTQIFEDFQVDPGWDERNNRIVAPTTRVVTQNFGYRTTNHAGSGAGEIGGIVDRSPLEGAYYGKLIGPLTFDDPLSFSGKVSILDATHTSGFTSSSDIFVGFFNSDQQWWRPANFLGFRLRGNNEPASHVASLELGFGTSAWEANAIDWGTTIFPGNQVHDFQLNYSPLSSGGRLSFSWDGTQILSLNMGSGHRANNAILNRFGIFSSQLPGSIAGNVMEAYFDDLSVNGEWHNFSTDPGWEGVGNQKVFNDPHLYGTNDFGFSQTNFAGGSSGEAGGLLWRVEDNEEGLQGYYADDVGTLTLEDHLVASGEIVSDRFSIDAGAMLGWFNSADQDWPPKNFVGVYMDSLSEVGRLFTPMYGTAAGTTKFAREPWMLFSPDGVPKDWTIEYSPQGRGAITVTLDGISKTLALESGDKAEGATFDRFGLFNMQDNNGKHSVIYLDNIAYTSNASGGTPVNHIEWAADISGDATVANRWTPQLTPNSNELTILLGDRITQPAVLFADVDIMMKSLQFDNANSYILAGQGSVNLESATNNASITVLAGSHEFQIQVNLNSDLDVTVSQGSTLTFNNGLDLNGFMLNKLGTGNLVINNTLTLDGGSINGIVINNAASVPEPSTLVLLSLALPAFSPAIRCSRKLRKQCS